MSQAYSEEPEEILSPEVQLISSSELVPVEPGR